MMVRLGFQPVFQEFHRRARAFLEFGDQAGDGSSAPFDPGIVVIATDDPLGRDWVLPGIRAMDVKDGL